MTTERGPGGPDNEVLRALSAAMAALFGDAPDSWLLDAEDVLAHLRESGYAIVATECYERMERAVTNARAYCFGLGQYGDLVAALRDAVESGDPDPVGGGE